MRIIEKQVIAAIGSALVSLSILIVGMQLSQHKDADYPHQYSGAEDYTDPEALPLFGSGSESVPAYALYIVEDRGWVVDCYSVGRVFVTPNSTYRFRLSDGSFLSRKAFCDLYL